MSDHLDAFLGQFYGTTKTASAPAETPSDEDQEKVAMFDLFIKTATEQTIDLSTLEPEKLTELYTKFEAGVKEAEAKRQAAEAAGAQGGQTPVTEKTAEQLALEAAQAEHQEKVAAAQKIAEADFLGRQMAHAFVDELKKVAAAEKGAEFPPPKDDKKDGGGPPPFPPKKDDDKDDKKDKEKEAAAFAERAKTAQAQLNASNFDVIAAKHAVELVKNASNGDAAATEQANRKMASVLELGLNKESVKTAGIQDFNQAVHVRALELLEVAGYQVDWSK